jgi:NADPH:quinone reductase-like Zn-dependent oxidoreductase
MKAIVQEGYGTPDVLALREIEKPVAGADQVLVNVSAASVNAADWHLLGSMLPHVIGRLLRSPQSRVRGLDLAGRVESIGMNVTRFKPGDEVFGAGQGSFAEYVATTADRLAPKPRNLSFEQAAAIPVAGITALQGLRDRARVEPGQKILVYGAGGGVGTFAVQIGRALGAHVTAVSAPENLSMLRSIGAHEVMDYTKEDFTRDGVRYDVLFDVGANRTLADCRRILTPDGVFILAGAPETIAAIIARLLQARLLSALGRQRIGSFLARVRREDLIALKELAEDGKITPVIERTYRLDETPEALRHLGTRRTRGKIVIRVG